MSPTRRRPVRRAHSPGCATAVKLSTTSTGLRIDISGGAAAALASASAPGARAPHCRRGIMSTWNSVSVTSASFLIVGRSCSCTGTAASFEGFKLDVTSNFRCTRLRTEMARVACSCGRSRRRNSTLWKMILAMVFFSMAVATSGMATFSCHGCLPDAWAGESSASWNRSKSKPSAVSIVSSLGASPGAALASSGVAASTDTSLPETKRLTRAKTSKRT
mmetsp:Transcript_36910/g.115582  ORF Transcript_36910/g.115582 Transcript_36910/m.115582 type:complete len:219 (+) Transcript_36910:170-826(+)